jgi:predicted membrane protein
MAMKRPAISFFVMVILISASLASADVTTRSERLSGEKNIRAEISISEGGLIICPGSAEEAFYAKINHSDRHKVRISYDRRGDEGVLKIKVEKIRKSFFGSRSRVKTLIKLPPSIPISLNVELGAGEADIDLSQLSLTGFDLDVGAGETEVDFGSPNPAVIDRMVLDAGVGEFTIKKMGNANCRKLELSGGVGSVKVDFSGEWQRDLSASISGGIGEAYLIFPGDLGVLLSASGMGKKGISSTGFSSVGSGNYRSDNFDAAKYHLNVSVSVGLGGIKVRWVK